VPFMSPVGVTWYLTALFVWRCSLQFIAKLRNVVAVTFAAGLAVGFVDTPRTENGGLPFLDYQRAAAFAPIFYVGATVLTEDVMRRLTDDVTTSAWGKIKRAAAWAATAATPALFAIAFSVGGSEESRDPRGSFFGSPEICFDEAQRWAWTMDPYVGGVDAAAGVGARAGEGHDVAGNGGVVGKEVQGEVGVEAEPEHPARGVGWRRHEHGGDTGLHRAVAESAREEREASVERGRGARERVAVADGRLTPRRLETDVSV